MMSYELHFNGAIRRLSDGAWVPADEGNCDYLEYLEWCDAGNSPSVVAEPEPVGDYQLFWDTLLNSDIYVAIREQAMLSLPMNTLVTELIALLTDAKVGHANETALQSSITAVLSQGSFSAEHIAQLSLAFEAANLDGVYTLS